MGKGMGGFTHSVGVIVVILRLVVLKAIIDTEGYDWGKKLVKFFLAWRQCWGVNFCSRGRTASYQ